MNEQPPLSLVFVCLDCGQVWEFWFDDPEQRANFQLGEAVTECCGAVYLYRGYGENVG